MATDSSIAYDVMISSISKNILSYWGSLIKITRKEKRMSQTALAIRLDVSRGKVQRIEKGDPKVSVGAYVEACIILGIPLTGCNKEHIHNLATQMMYTNALVPTVRQKKGRDWNFYSPEDYDDDF